MLNLETNVPQTNPGVGNRPFGVARNDTLPGDETGTPWIEKVLNDLYYGFYSVLYKAGVTPSGVGEDVSTSDFYNALVKTLNTHKSANFLNPTPQDTPNNTVKLARGVTRDPNDPNSEPVIILAGSADLLPVTGVTILGQKRRDRFVYDKFGVISKLVGTQAVTPTPPPIPTGFGPICQVLVSTVGTPVIDNVQDIIIDERDINQLPKLDTGVTPGKTVLSGRINANGTTNLLEDYGSGASFSVNRPTTGEYRVSLSGLGAFSQILVQYHLRFNNFRAPIIKGIADLGTINGWGTPAGFTLKMEALIDIGIGILLQTPIDADFYFTVEGIN
jgi:hypothetical protein